MDYADFFSHVSGNKLFLAIESPNHVFESLGKKLHFFYAGKVNAIISPEEIQNRLIKLKNIHSPYIAQLEECYISEKKELWLGYQYIEGDLFKEILKKKSCFNDTEKIISLFNSVESIFSVFRNHGYENLIFDSSHFLIDDINNHIVFINWASHLLLDSLKEAINSMTISSLIFYTAIVEKSAIHEFDIKRICKFLDKQSFISPLPDSSERNRHFNSTILSYLSNKTVDFQSDDSSVISEFVSKLSFRLSRRDFYPCLSEIYSSVIESNKASSVNYIEISNAILKDFPMSFFFFRKANLVTEKKNGFIDTLSKGLLYVGYQEMMSSFRSFKSMDDLDPKDNKKEYIDLWVMSALHAYLAESIARAFVKPLNIEFIRIMALMKNMGAFAIVYTMPEIWRKIYALSLNESISDEIASSELMPLSLNQLSRELVKVSRMNERVINALENIKKIHKNETLDEESIIRYIITLSQEIAKTIGFPFIKDKKSYLAILSKFYLLPLSLTEEKLYACITDAVIKFIADSPYTILSNSDAYNRILFFKKHEFSRSFDSGMIIENSSKTSVVVTPDLSGERAQAFTHSYQKLIQEQDKKKKLREFLSLAIAHYDFEDVLFLLNKDKSNTLFLSDHVGNNAELFNKFKIPALKTKDLFQSANQSGKPIYVGSVTDKEISGFVPAWYITVSAYPPSFLYIPLKKLISCGKIGSLFLSRHHVHEPSLNHIEIQSIIDGFSHLELFID